MSNSVRCKLVDYIDDLRHDEYKKFKMHLEEYPIEEGYKPIRRSKTEKADATEIARLMVWAYEEAKALQMAVSIFERINRKDLSERVRREMPSYFRQSTKPLTKEEERRKNEKICSNLYDKFFGTEKKVEVILDPKTAFPTLVLSEDRKSVYLGSHAQPLPDNPERFRFIPCVLGAEGIDSGTVEWVVEVGKAKSWAIGAVRKSIDRKGYPYLTATEGCWLLKLNGGEYEASTTPSTILPLWKSPQSIKIHLEYDFGILTFYDAKSMERLFTFNYPFSEVMFPFFQVWDTEIPLKICPCD
ncbi:butyrophilin subfamily 3 member A1-like [Sceloporus undulatus]|uniref:butyrophilin subfamily 3 member A1-like n=1 Tax=Sceloporus undulatus TaxID=8520 RepID=UPI001C4D28F5|nr:butyrophilin subfamily 3 member A1-like [Sceloporus undulatus]